jgi:hypothetical protein
MYQVPTRADFDRKLRALIQDARTTSEQETNRIGAELAARGLGASSGPVISTIADRFDACVRPCRLYRTGIGRQTQRH